MMTKEAYMALYEKYLTGQCSAEEARLLEEYRDTFELTDLPWDEVALGNQEQLRRRIRKRLFRQIDRSGFPWYWYPAAVLIIGLALSTGIYLRQQTINGSFAHQEPILPGGNKALLTLENGTQIALDQVDLSKLSEQGQEAIRKLDDGLLVYGDPAAKQPTHQYHTVSTPRGGQFRIELADGTIVWLNAESSIRFPLEFSGNERWVTVSGEVFFDVKKQADKPFVVQCEAQNIQVLGTSFVVTSYPDEPTQQTALLEGKVRVSMGTTDYQLEPGERAVYNTRKKQVKKENFDPEEALAWKSGYFLFTAEPVESVMRKIARWYDVEVLYQGNMQGKQFSGSISRYDQIKDVLDMLALTGTVKFNVEGRRVTVMD